MKKADICGLVVGYFQTAHKVGISCFDQGWVKSEDGNSERTGGTVRLHSGRHSQGKCGGAEPHGEASPHTVGRH